MCTHTITDGTDYPNPRLGYHRREIIIGGTDVILLARRSLISIASGALMVRACRLDHLSLCVCVSVKCIVAKRLIGSGCRLEW